MRCFTRCVVLMAVSLALGLSAAKAHTQTPSSNAPLLFNAVYNASACADSAAPTWCSGSDVGGWINAAYAHCPDNQGCEIDVPNATNSYYVTFTTIAFTHPGKVVVLDCLSQNGTQNTGITYQGHGAAVIVDNGSVADPTNAGSTIRNCFFYGTGANSSQVGVVLGASPGNAATNGAIGTRIEKSKFSNFGTAVLYGSNTYNTVIDNSSFIGNGNHVVMPQGTTDSGENLATVIGSTFIRGNFSLYGGEYRFLSDSIDAGIVHLLGGAFFDCLSCHFEAYDPSQLPLVDAANANTINILGGSLEQDAATGTPAPMFTLSGISVLNMYGVSAATNLRLPEVVKMSGSSTLNFTAPGTFFLVSFDRPFVNSGSGAAFWGGPGGTQQGTPTLNSSGARLNPGSTNAAGAFTLSNGSVTGQLALSATSYPHQPNCTFVDETTPSATAHQTGGSRSAATFATQSGRSGDTISYTCPAGW